MKLITYNTNNYFNQESKGSEWTFLFTIKLTDLVINYSQSHANHEVKG